MYKFGKRPRKWDRRNIRLHWVLKVLPPIPDKFDIDSNLPGVIPTPMFANDRKGDCVIAGRAHQTLRFEDFEQKTIIPITDDEILEQYYKEGTHNCCLLKWLDPEPDRGLVLLDSLKSWRKDGWIAGGKHYDIYAFAEIDALFQGEIRASIFLLNGINMGLRLPHSAIEQFQQRQTWDLVLNDGGIVGGHCVYGVAYDTQGITCVTWARKQKMTWPFFYTYCDVCYAIIDNRDKWLGDESPVNIEELDRYLKEITA